MKAKDKTTGTFKEVYVKALDSLPVGSEIDFEGTDIPVGWEETTDPESYSTDEVKTNKIWIDGKPVYRKVLSGGPVSANSLLQILTGVNDIDTMLDTRGFGLTSIKDWFELSRAHNNFNYQIAYYYENAYKRFNIETGSSIDLNTVYIIMEYTKTTD